MWGGQWRRGGVAGTAAYVPAVKLAFAVVIGFVPGQMGRSDKDRLLQAPLQLDMVM